MMERKFPADFIWGAAISAYQTEGGNQWSDWGARAGKACDFWNRYEYYLDLAKHLGLRALRFSLEWSRLMPEPDQWNEAAGRRYGAIIEAVKSRGMKPFVTLWHFTLPQWLASRGGWTHPAAVGQFAEYVKRTQELWGQDSAINWITLNEPSGYASQGYLTGEWPPGEKFRPLSFIGAIRNLERAHHEAAKIVKAHAGRVGIALNLPDTTGFRPLAAAESAFNDWHFLKKVAASCDFIGINYYFHECLGLRLGWPFVTRSCGNLPKSDLGWELYPEGIAAVALKAAKFGKPIYITENGLADSADRHRPWFLYRTVRALSQALEAGADVRGYLHWSLMDNFEWARGFEPKFGLYAMDYATLTARPRKSAKLYREIIRMNGPAESLKRLIAIDQLNESRKKMAEELGLAKETETN